MIYIALGCLLLALVLTASGRSFLKGVQWRYLSGALAVVAFTGAAVVGVRGAWGSAIVLVVVGLWLAASTRRAKMAPPRPRAGGMSLSEARSILGVEEGADAKTVQAAYLRLMRMAHPDKGGTSGLAAQLTAARDRLLKG